jgi:hypothetical protein
MQDLELDRDDFRSRFGSRDVSRFYARCKKVALERRIFKFYDVETGERENVLTIANSYRLRRDNATMAVTVEEIDYVSGVWNVVENAHVFKRVPLWPVTNLRMEACMPFAHNILWKLFKEAGEEEVRSAFAAMYSAAMNEHLSRGLDRDEARRLVPLDGNAVGVAKLWFTARIFGAANVSGGPIRKPKHDGKDSGKIGIGSVYNALKGIRTAFHKHIREPEVFKAVLSTNHKYMTLFDYVHYAAYREGLLKVWRERKNLVPMLPYINRAYWSEDTLFARREWVGQDCRVSRPDFEADDERPALPGREASTGRFAPFADAASFNWLGRSKNTVVKTWLRDGGKSAAVASFVAALNLPKTAPAVLVSAIVREAHSGTYRLNREGRFGVRLDDPRVRTVFAAYASHFMELKRTEGFREMVVQLFRREGNIQDVLDYLVAEGFEQGLPERNATWASLMRRADDWHGAGDLGIAMKAERRFDPGTAWEFLVGEREIDECRVVPIRTVAEMQAEGQSMGHCIATYTASCVGDHYRAYGIVEPGGARATVGFFLNGGVAKFDQVRGPGNREVSPLAAKVAKRVVEMYADAMRQRIYEAA